MTASTGNGRVEALRAFVVEDLLRAVMIGTFAPRAAAQWPKVH
ncbi:MAG TPA: hypothetical protein VFY90_12010 [Tepidiformaceae bacterium]|nr:hypothetical protein [Tepidiformaceae bacterium]